VRRLFEGGVYSRAASIRGRHLFAEIRYLQDKEERWLGYAADQKVSLLKETFPMTIWGVCRSCLGDVFEGAEEVERLADCYHKCWREMEVREDDREEGGRGSSVNY